MTAPEKKEMKLPPQLTAANIAMQFMQLARDRYPTPAKVLQTADKLGISGNVIAQIAVYSQMRDAVRELDPLRVFGTFQHRDEVYDAIILALEQLEDQAEEP